jgi:hypothetical protein
MSPALSTSPPVLNYRAPQMRPRPKRRTWVIATLLLLQLLMYLGRLLLILVGWVLVIMHIW